MMMILSIALRNVFRNGRRTALTVLVITFGAVAMILAGGFCAYNYEGLRETTIRNGLGHLQVFTARYLADGEDRPLENGIEDFRTLESWLEEQEHVAATAAQVDFVGLISNGEKSVAFLGRGVEVERQMLLGFNLNVKRGEPLWDPAASQVLLGTGLAETLSVEPGDLVTLLSTTVDGALNAIDAEVVGLFTTGVAAYDARTVRMPLAAAQLLIDSDRVTKLIVKLDATRHTEEVAASIIAASFGSGGNEFELRTWKDLAGFYRQVKQLYDAIFLFVGLIIVSLVVLSSSNTMMMSVFERVKEIGTLMAIGTRRRQVLTIFLLEGFFIGVLGGAVGLVASWGLIELINGAGLMMPPPPTFSTGFPLLIKVVPGLFAAVFALMVATLTVAAIVPAARGARLEIVQALGHV